jgi:hypothetical protein
MGNNWGKLFILCCGDDNASVKHSANLGTESAAPPRAGALAAYPVPAKKINDHSMDSMHCFSRLNAAGHAYSRSLLMWSTSVLVELETRR